MTAPRAPHEPDPRRFDVSRGTLFLDRLMSCVIRVGGIAVILAVFGICFFILKEILPLFGSAKVMVQAPLGAGTPLPEPPRILGVDEAGEMPFLYQGSDRVTFVDAATGVRRETEVPGLEGLKVTAAAHDPVQQRVAIGLDDGRVGSFLVRHEATFDSSGKRKTEPVIEPEPWFPVAAGNGPVRALAYGDGGTSRMLAVIRDGPQGPVAAILRLGSKRSLIGGSKLSLLGETEVTPQLPAAPVHVLASQNGSAVLVLADDGQVAYFKLDEGTITLRQVFRPFPDAKPSRLDFLFGGVSVVATAPDGRQAIFSLFRPQEQGERLYGKTKEFPKIPAGSPVFAASLRNKAFLTGSGTRLSLRHATSQSIRWEGDAGFPPVLAAVNAKSDVFFLAGSNGEIQRLNVSDPHPEAGWRAFFGKVWYEGGSKPVYQWQSTGGTDDFEPKLSLIPLIIGSLKGTLYALLFSVPVALLAAVFSASFLSPRAKQMVKPVMEIMASLPSVVLGFLAGLWLAPLIEERVPSIMLTALALPVSALALGAIACRLPTRVRTRLEGGREWLVVLPVLALALWLAWSMGPVVERWCFVHTDPATGQRVADFRLWWPQATGTSYDQRNSLVVGFMMGFAVIPVIFTITEDSLTNVPKSLTAAASALGASRWQVIRTIALPVASPGIFSALMIGFGRAVGETMIVVMATGNTPVTEWNLFSGMRTLSANIAVELPEAAPGSTHYRTLFLGALVLFLLTFALNTAAELLRQRLRERNQVA